MNPIRGKFTLPQEGGGAVRVVEVEIPQKTGDEGMRVFERFCRKFGPALEPDPRFDAIMADDRKRREKAAKRLAKLNK